MEKEFNLSKKITRCKRCNGIISIRGGIEDAPTMQFIRKNWCKCKKLAGDKLST